MQTLPRFTFYSDLQCHIAHQFEQQCSDQNLNQDQFWKALRDEAERLAPHREYDPEYQERMTLRAEAFIDGLQHNFSKLCLLDSEYLIDGYWLPIAKAPAARLRDSDCRIVWRKTGVVYGEIPYSRIPLKVRTSATPMGVQP